MKYNLRKFGKELQSELKKDFNIVNISRWAHEKYLSECSNLDAAAQAAFMQVIVMEEGPEFEMTEIELKEFAERLASISDSQEEKL